MNNKIKMSFIIICINIVLMISLIIVQLNWSNESDLYSIFDILKLIKKMEKIDPLNALALIIWSSLFSIFATSFVYSILNVIFSLKRSTSR
jgi:hypothetical protein